MHWLVIFIGGGLGSLCRYGITRLVLLLRYNSLFPLSTIIANILACAVMALVMNWIATGEKTLNQNWQLFWLVGFCGGFSTFSTFSFENWVLYRQGHFTFLLLNILVSLILCFLVFAVMGRKISV